MDPGIGFRRSVPLPVACPSAAASRLGIAWNWPAVITACSNISTTSPDAVVSAPGQLHGPHGPPGLLARALRPVGVTARTNLVLPLPFCVRRPFCASCGHPRRWRPLAADYGHWVDIVVQGVQILHPAPAGKG
jgi:hypothetical protein